MSTLRDIILDMIINNISMDKIVKLHLWNGTARQHGLGHKILNLRQDNWIYFSVCIALLLKNTVDLFPLTAVIKLLGLG